MADYTIRDMLAAYDEVRLRHEVATVRAVLDAVAISPLMRTPAQWSALGMAYNEPPIFPAWDRSEPTTRVAVEPGFFTLAGARNLAAAYRPEVP